MPNWGNYIKKTSTKRLIIRYKVQVYEQISAFEENDWNLLKWGDNMRNEPRGLLLQYTNLIRGINLILLRSLVRIEEYLRKLWTYMRQIATTSFILYFIKYYYEQIKTWEINNLNLLKWEKYIWKKSTNFLILRIIESLYENISI